MKSKQKRERERKVKRSKIKRMKKRYSFSSLPPPIIRLSLYELIYYLKNNLNYPRPYYVTKYQYGAIKRIVEMNPTALADEIYNHIAENGYEISLVDVRNLATDLTTN